MSHDFGVNQGLVEEMFLRWASNAASVPEPWQRYFDGLPQAEWPQLTSAGGVPAPFPTANGGLSAPSNGHGMPAQGSQGEPSISVYMPPDTEQLPFVERRSTPPSAEVLAANELQGRLTALINAYRVRGHLYADLDPLGLRSEPADHELFLERFGLADVDPETVFSTGDMAGPSTATLKEIVDRLSHTYTRSIGAEFTFLEDREARGWL
ncbi:MAG: 2-oxoglutarate dehydrogenase E1 component, partial [Myxococcota bacterium]